jgi:lipopolysaccharide/colanic/teichoic acid biosynthesis glycosyltransferase
MYRKLIKQLIDFIVALIVLLILSPLIIILIIGLAFANGGSPFFVQRRVGYNNEIFKVIKFKTMNDKKSGDGTLLPDVERLTSVGRFVRKTSMDELPQLINVLRREMSLIGPRPLLSEYLTLYDKMQIRRHEVMPGITGWAQVNGRNAISWTRKFELDVWYVDNMSLALDLKIVWMTIRKVLRSDGVSAEGVATMEKFRGNMN